MAHIKIERTQLEESFEKTKYLLIISSLNKETLFRIDLVRDLWVEIATEDISEKDDRKESSVEIDQGYIDQPRERSKMPSSG